MPENTPNYSEPRYDRNSSYNRLEKSKQTSGLTELLVREGLEWQQWEDDLLLNMAYQENQFPVLLMQNILRRAVNSLRRRLWALFTNYREVEYHPKDRFSRAGYQLNDLDRAAAYQCFLHINERTLESCYANLSNVANRSGAKEVEELLQSLIDTKAKSRTILVPVILPKEQKIAEDIRSVCLYSSKLLYKRYRYATFGFEELHRLREENWNDQI